MTSEGHISRNPRYNRWLSTGTVGSLLLLFLVAVAGIAKADSTTLDFEGFPDSTILITQYPGLTFTNTIILTAGISLNEFEFPPHSGVNVASDNNGPITIDFSTPITSFSGYFTYVEPLTLDGFDATNTEVASATSLYSSNDALFGDPGSSPNELIGLSYAGGMASVTITGDPAGESFVMDDVTYATTVTAVPEPNALLMMASIIVATVGKRFVNMKKLLIISAVIGLLTVGVVALYAQSSTTLTLISPVAMPSTLLTNTSAQVTITIPISSSAVISSGVNLIQIAPGGAQTILGQLNDDGQNGDQVADDGIYSLRLPFTPTSLGTINLEVSVALKGLLKRSISPILSIPIYSTPPGLPPDPGSAGMQTLAGTDSDEDGIRDDVERYIALTYPQSAKTRMALTQLTQATQGEILNASNKTLSVAFALQEFYAADCLDYVTASGDADVTGMRESADMQNALQAQILNTPARTEAYFQADSQLGALFYSRPHYSGLSARCTFDPNSLPN